MNSTALAQSRTTETAALHGEQWTASEVDALLELSEVEKDEDVAYVLERTLYAVRSKLHELRHQGGTSVDERAPKRVSAWDQGFTSLEAMGF